MPELIYLIEKFLEKNVTGFSHRTYLVYKLQLLLLLILAGVFLNFLLPADIFLIVELALIVILLYELASEGREEFKGDFFAYLYFFMGAVIIVQLSWIGPALFPQLITEVYFPLGLIVLLVVFVAVFWFLFGRSYSFGKVLMSDGERLLIETEFDLRASITSKKQFLKSSKKFKNGQRVKLKLKRGVFGAVVKEIEKE